MTSPNKIDSNVSGLAWAEEASIGVLPGSPVWYAAEPNTYKDFGAQYTSKARNPINPYRQRRKGSLIDLKASGGFTADVTHVSHTRLMQGFLFADVREKLTTVPTNGSAVLVTAVSSTLYSVVATFTAGQILFAEGFGVSGNNGMKVATAAAAGVSVSAAGLATEASPPAAATLSVVGQQLASDDLAVVAPGGAFPYLQSTALDFTTLGLVPGEWIWVGGDTAASNFVNAVNSGFARIFSITAHVLTLDKTQSLMIAETTTGKTIQIFMGSVVKNETTAALIKRRTYQLERTLGNDGVGVQSEYLIGAVPNEMIFTIKASNAIECDTTFMGIDNIPVSGSVGVKAGTRVAAPFVDMFNAASDVFRIRLSTVDGINSYITPLAAYIMDATLTIKNNSVENKAIGILGAFDVTAGTFELNMSLTAYFQDQRAVNAIRSNLDTTIDFVLVKQNRGMIIDAPLMSLGGGRNNVVQDKPVELALTPEAARSVFGHTMLFMHFSYLPNAA